MLEHLHGRGRIGNKLVMPVREVGESLFRLPWLLLSHGDFELVRGVGTLGRVPRHLDREVAQRGVGRSLERDFRRRVPVLDDRAGGFNGHSFGSVGEIERDVPLEVFAALDTDRDFFRLSLMESG